MTQNIGETDLHRRPDFVQTLKKLGRTIERRQLKTVQVNMGRLCNQACEHCHVKAAPGRMEVMKRGTVERLLRLLDNSPQIETVDITGGAPELNPNFRYLVSKAYQFGKRIIDRCYLTVLLEPGQEDTAGFLRDHRVEIVASMPCYSEENVDRQRGRGVFKKSIQALKMLNAIGYGQPGKKLLLNLVYNPGGAFLPGNQKQLEKDYKRHLGEEHGIEFDQLFTITNMPIERFERSLKRDKQWEAYRNLLIDNFNPQAAEEVMCRELISIGWDGVVYDCDFNQMLDLPKRADRPTIQDFERFADLEKNIVFADHCYGCTAGAGSSCGGALDEPGIGRPDVD
ncbi:MAG: radical SAM/Cys-rich domain protein [Proteobacteria bacterium]|nr:radical SAM/Cys-rich domain protein [Pseudomonadota bacterium]